MIYTVMFDLEIEDDEIYSEEQVREYIKAGLNDSITTVKNVKLMEVND